MARLKVASLRRDYLKVNRARFAVLGDNNGRVYVPNKLGRVYVRFEGGIDANGVTQYSSPVEAYHEIGADYYPVPNQRVRVKYDEYNNLVVTGADKYNVIDNGMNPSITNRLAPENNFLYLQNIIPLKAIPQGTATTASTLVTVMPLVYDHYNDYQVTSTIQVDLASYVPIALYHRIVILWLDTYTNTVTVSASTSQTIATDIDSTDIDECFAYRPADGIPIAGFRLQNAEANVTQSNVYEDYRQFLNVPPVIGYANPLTFNTRIRSGYTLDVYGDYYAVDATLYAYGTLLNVGALNSVSASSITGILPVKNGGTGSDMSGTGGTSFVVKQSSAGGAFTSALITSTELTTALTTPPAIGGTTANTGRFTTITATTATSSLASTTFSGVTNLGFTYITPSASTYMTGFWVPRLSDFTSTYFQDYQDEFAYFHKRASATVTASTAVSTGSLDNMFIDNAGIASWASGASVSPLVIECDTVSTPIANAGNAYFNVGLTFRNNGAGSLPSNIKIEFWNNTSGLYETVYDVAQTASNYIGTAFAVWLSPRLLAPSSLFNIYKVRLTLTVATPLPATLSIQRLMLYHPTASWDTFKLGIGGGTVWGATGFNAVASATQQLISKANSSTIVPITAQGATSQSANLQQWQDSSAVVLARIDKDGGAVFNENGTSTGDVRIEGDTDANLLFTDASADSVGIKTSTPNSRLQVNGSLSLPIVSKSADYTATIDDYTIVFTASATLNLPTAVGIAGRVYCVKSASGVTVTIDPNGTETIDGNLTHSSTSLKAHQIQSDGANWWIISQY